MTQPDWLAAQTIELQGAVKSWCWHTSAGAWLSRAYQSVLLQIVFDAICWYRPWQGVLQVSCFKKRNLHLFSRNLTWHHPVFHEIVTTTRTTCAAERRYCTDVKADGEQVSQLRSLRLMLCALQRIRLFINAITSHTRQTLNNSGENSLLSLHSHG